VTEETQASRHGRELTVDSDWITTFGAVALFIICLMFLAADARNLIWGHLRGPVLIHKSFWSIWNKSFETIASIYLFILAFNIPQKALKVACALMGVRLASFVLLSLFNISAGVRSYAAVIGTIISQIALIIFCVAIAQWIKRVVRWSAPSQPQGGGH